MHKFTSLVEDSLLNGVNTLKKQQLNLDKCLPTSFLGKLFVAKFSAKQVVIAASSCVWANKARYYIPIIQENLMVSSVKITVMPDAFATTSPKPSPKARKHLSSQARACLQSCATAISDPDISSALQQLLDADLQN